ncbi:putative polycomb group protein EMBRYONIC FLOWER 2-like isoform X2 [Capsicum annuum]|nr:putative polycomb group protein EMBRYONIC FLOWER 2-like isoform X2 [Capsicum annuum]
MPGIPLVARETTQGSATHLSAEEEVAAEESLSSYCKPVELYNILQRRAVRNVMNLREETTFCLFSVKASDFGVNFLVDVDGLTNIVDLIGFVYLHQTVVSNFFHQARLWLIYSILDALRIQLAISALATVNDESQVQNLFPLCVILAKPVSSAAAVEAYSAVYQFKRACISTSFSGVDGINRAQAKFFLPEINKLSAEIRAGSLVILFVSFGRHSFSGIVFHQKVFLEFYLLRFDMKANHLLFSAFAAELVRDHVDTSSFPCK